MKKLSIVALGLFTGITVYAQPSPKGWHLLDPTKDGIFGISLEKAHKFLSQKKAQPIIVAVLDGGIDTTHEALKPVLWKNPKEIPGNGIDDDGNGYIDDVYGWNFLGGKDGKNVDKCSDEKSRVFHNWKTRFNNGNIDTNFLSPGDRKDFKTWKRAEAEMQFSKDEELQVMYLDVTLKALKKHNVVLQEAMGKEVYSLDELEKFNGTTKSVKESKAAFLNIMRMLEMEAEEKNTSVIQQIEDYVEGKKRSFEALEKAPENYRLTVIGDDYFNINDRFYGNADVMGPNAMHGTHVSGIIAGRTTTNQPAYAGIAPNASIMTLRVVPDGDEYDKDIALGIIYAVDNGAKVINMSFGKSYSPEKYWVDSAVAYAEKKDVLLIHAAGNESNDLDIKENYPNGYLLKLGRNAQNFLNIGASGDPKVAGPYLTDFSNTGLKSVDLFAPGNKIFSTLPTGNEYGLQRGTSMAAPVVSGIAALIRSYYPQLTAVEVKDILMKSVVFPTTDDGAILKQKSITGGIVNAYQAIVLADQLASKKKTTAPKKK